MFTDNLKNLAVELNCGPGSSNDPDCYSSLSENELKATLLSTQEEIDDFAGIEEIENMFDHFLGTHGVAKFRQMDLSSLGKLDDLLQ